MKDSSIMMTNNISTLLFLLLIITSCTGQQQTMKKFEWRPTANAPKYYPAEIISGNFYMEDGSSIYIPKGHTLMTGWGKAGAAHAVGEDMKPVPYKFDVKWVSYLEEKFYGGTFKLPKEQLTKLFEEGFINDRNEKDTYSKIVLGLAPGGIISVWLRGGSAKEIGRYQASEIEVDEKEFIPYANMSNEKYIKETKSEIIEEKIKSAIDVKNIPFGIWDTYRKKYKWAINVNFKAEGKNKLKTIIANSYNGEFFNTSGENPIITKMIERAIPSRIAMSWQDTNGNGYGAKVFFDEEEIFKTFDIIFQQKTINQATLILDIDKYNSNLEVFILANDEKYSITKAEIKVYEASN